MKATSLIPLFLILASAGRAAETTSADFYQAIRQNDLAKLKAISKSADAVNVADSRGVTPLMHAASIGTVQAMKVLIDAGARVNAKSGLDSTALLYAAVDEEKTRLLLNAGADVNIASKIGRSPLIVAAGRQGGSQTVRMLLQKGAEIKGVGMMAETSPLPVSNALIEAALANDLASLKLLLAARAPLDEGNFVSLTALGLAAGHGNVEAVKFLLKSGANVNATHSRELKVKNGLIAATNISPLMTAGCSGSVEVVRLLLSAKANVNARDVRGMTPLMLAVACDGAGETIVKLLLDAGATVNLKSKDNETARDWALKFGRPEILRLLGGEVSSSKMALLRPAAVANNELAAAVARAAALLQATSAEFFKQTGCVGCHHQNLSVIAISSAVAKGLTIDNKAATEQRAIAKGELLRSREAVLQGVFISLDGLVYSMNQLAEQNYPADDVTDALAAAIASHQSEDGSWGGLPLGRPPLEDSKIQRAALAIRALEHYQIPARKAEFEERVQRARNWLSVVKPQVPYERSYQLLGMNWAGAKQQELDRLAKDLRSQQRPDGGWPQLATLPSDAYASGLAMYALARTGTKPTDAVYQRGVKFLLGSQAPDGSWYVPSRSPKLQPYFESGFPYNHDQWISAAATSWAAVALAEAIEPNNKSAALR